MCILAQTWSLGEYGWSSLERAKGLDMGPGLHLSIGVECRRPSGQERNSPGKVRTQSVLVQLEIKGG